MSSGWTTSSSYAESLGDSSVHPACHLPRPPPPRRRPCEPSPHHRLARCLPSRRLVCPSPPHPRQKPRPSSAARAAALARGPHRRLRPRPAPKPSSAARAAALASRAAAAPPSSVARAAALVRCTRRCPRPRPAPRHRPWPAPKP